MELTASLNQYKILSDFRTMFSYSTMLSVIVIVKLCLQVA